MKKPLKLLLKLFSILVVIFFLLACWVAFFVDINQYKAEISQLVEQQAGLKLEITGDLNLTLLSGIKFNAKEIKLFNDKELIADIESVRLGLSAYSLYRGEPEVTSLDVSIRRLIMNRDKKGYFNFLPLYTPEKNIEAANSASEKLSLNALALKNISLSMEHFQYKDQLNAFSTTLINSKASLSLLPIIENHALVIAQPGILVDYTYTGEVEINTAIINHYQISGLSMSFNNNRGDLISDDLIFSFLEEGKQHAPPPVLFDADGKIALTVRYPAQDDPAKMLWVQPEAMTIDHFDVNLEKLKVIDKGYQITAQTSHIVFNDMTLFANSHSLLSELQITVLDAQSKKVTISNKKQGNYVLNQPAIQLKNTPLIHKGKPVQALSKAFLNSFARQGSIKLSSDSVEHNNHNIDKLDIAIKGANKQIDLLLSSSILKSAVKTEGFIKTASESKDKNQQWQLKIYSKQLDLKVVSELINYPVKMAGFAAIDSFLSGQYQGIDFKVAKGKIHTSANNLKLYGINVNKILEDFESSQSVGLLDVGAVVILGPGGLLLSKGNDYHSLVQSIANTGNSKISRLNLSVDIANDIISMRDVAFSTEKHRLAVKGKINYKKEKFIGLDIATVNKNGCAIYKEEVQGTFKNPQVKKANFIVKSVINPITSLVSKVTDSLKIQCQPRFYQGVVKAPPVSSSLKFK